MLTIVVNFFEIKQMTCIWVAICLDESKQFDLIHGLIEKIFIVWYYFETSEFFFIRKQIFDFHHSSKNTIPHKRHNLISSHQHFSDFPLRFFVVFKTYSFSLVDYRYVHDVVDDVVVLEGVEVVLAGWKYYSVVEFTLTFLLRNWSKSVFSDRRIRIPVLLGQLCTAFHQVTLCEIILVVA